ncbi:transcriptional regulator, partial [Mesorhizobium sp. M2D.F.Ca.ET.145.01.1.1]
TRAEVVGTNRMITLRRADLDARFPGLLDSVIAAAADDTALPAVGGHDLEMPA